jgi:mannosyltransferase
MAQRVLALYQVLDAVLHRLVRVHAGAAHTTSIASPSSPGQERNGIFEPVATGFASLPAASPSKPAWSRGLVFGALIISVLALIVRFSTLTLQSFWLDEAYTEHLVHLGFGAMLSTIPRSESTPPLYYVLAWGWTHLLGYSELALRSVSAIAGAATVTAGYALAARLAGARAAVIAGALLAVSPLMVWYSQEARAYSLAALFATGTILCLIRYSDTLRRGWLIAWAGSAALGLCTHYFVGFVVLPELVWLIWRLRARREVKAAVALVVLVAVALVPLALAQRGTGHTDYIAQGSLPTRSLQVPKQFLVGYASPGQLVTAPLAALIVLAGGLWPLARSRAALDRSTLIVLAVGLSCLLVPFVLALVGVDFINTRNLLPALPALLVVASVGFAVSAPWPRGAVPAAFLAGLFALVLLLVDTDVRYQRADWRGASAALGVATEPRALVVTPGSGLLPLQVYEPGLRVLVRAERVSEIDVVGLPAQATGDGLGPAPRPRPPFAIPPQFHLIGASYARTYTVLRYRTAAPVSVTPALLAPSHFGTGGFAALLQLPAERLAHR